jgi:heat shock protein HtpX
MGARLKVALAFMALWVVFIALAYGIVFLLLYTGTIAGDGFYTYTILIMIPILLLFNLVTYFFSDRMVLAAYQAKMVDERGFPKLARIVARIANGAGLPMPRLAIIPSSTPNAFATGRDPEHAVVAVTQGILTMLSEDELEAVLGHEMAHVKDRDILLMTVIASAAAIISVAARMAIYQMLYGRRDTRVNPLVLLFAAITAPIAAMLVQLAVSRRREYKADAVGARMTMKPHALARALGKLHSMNNRRPMQMDGSSPAHASLFIVNPFTRGSFVSLFSTHPPVEERIRRLERLADREGFLG